MLSKKNCIKIVFLLVFCSICQISAISLSGIEIDDKSAPVFPQFLFTDTLNDLKRDEYSRPYWVNTKEEVENTNRITENKNANLLDEDILAFYGHPNSRNMGILGRYSIEELDKLLTSLAAEYEAESGGRKIQKAFYLIYGTVWPEGEIGIMSNSTLMPYIEYGLENDILVFVDHQIGKYDPIDSLRRILPLLRYPNVHLALDPEWRTTKPMQEIGSITAEELNTAQRVMEDYMIQNNILGERMLVIHQFNYVMIKNRENVRANSERVKLIHCADGFGPPNMKRDAYAFNAQAANMPLKGFKLFYNLGIPGAGYDNPLMTPKEVYQLNPRPYVIMYQ